MPGTPPWISNTRGGWFFLNIGSLFRPHPLVGKFLSAHSVERLQDSDQERDARKLVLSQQAFAIFL